MNGTDEVANAANIAPDVVPLIIRSGRSSIFQLLMSASSSSRWILGLVQL